MKNLYVLAWFLLAVIVLVSTLTGIITPTALVAYSFAALGLVYGLVFWSIFTNTREIRTE